MSFSEPSSSSSTSTCRLPVDARMPSATASPFGTSRAVRITWAPLSARTRAVSCPNPPDPPVTSATFPRKSMPSATSLAVVSAPNFVASRLTILLWLQSRALESKASHTCLVRLQQRGRTVALCLIRPRHRGDLERIGRRGALRPVARETVQQRGEHQHQRRGRAGDDHEEQEEPCL